MKRLYILIISVIVFTQVYSQNNYVDDALKLSKNNYGGTARFIGMSGAFGALGGDFSSIAINPAGVGVYRSSEFVFSPGFSMNNNSSNYINNNIDESGFRMNVNNASFIASYDLEDVDSRWVNFNIGIGFNRLTDLNDDVIFEGVNNSSLMELFVSNANDKDIGATPTTIFNLSEMYERLLWDAYILDSTSTDGVFFNEIDDAVWNDPNNFEINQRKILKSEGSMNEFNIAFGGNFAHKLYVGANIGVNWLNYDLYTSHYEYETDAYLINYMRGFDFKTHEKTSGRGVNLKLGVIYKPIDAIRIGLAFHTPTIYEVNKEYYNEVYGYFDADPDEYAKTNKYNYEYQLQTPGRGMASLGFKIGKIALIDIDYEYVDYSSIKLDDDFSYEPDQQSPEDDNKIMKEEYQPVHNIRLGGELRIGSLYLRGGGKYSTSPYTYNEDNTTIGYSFGVGFREKNLFIDAAFAQSKESYLISAYNWQYNSAVANIENTLSRFVLTFGVRF